MLNLHRLRLAATQTDPCAISVLSGPLTIPREEAGKDLGVANKAFPWHELQPTLGLKSQLPADLLDARRHLGARMPMLAGKLVQVSDRVVADRGQLGAFSLGGVPQKGR